MDYKDLDLRPLDEDQIADMGLSEADLWMMKFEDGNVHGPFDTKSLIESSKVYEEEFEFVEIFNLIIEKWAPFFKTTQFQRRMPKLVPAQNLSKSQSFHVLIMGQSFGPYSLDELKQMTEDKKLRLNSEVSIDSGKTWMKMYEHHEFDRRLIKNQDDLPFVPSPSIIEENEERLALVEEISSQNENSSSIIAGLAFVGRGNDAGHRIKYHKKTKEEEKLIEEEKESFHGPKFFQTKKFVQACASFAVIAFVSLSYLNYQSSSQNIDTGYAESKVSPKQINNSQRRVKKRLPASVKDKKKTKPLQARAKRLAPPKIKTSQTRRVIHTHEHPEQLNLDDPRVRDEIARDIAGDEYLDEQYNEEDIVEHYDEEPVPMNEPYVEPMPLDAEPMYDEQVESEYPEDMDPEENY
jgi:hypothetical protein